MQSGIWFLILSLKHSVLYGLNKVCISNLIFYIYRCTRTLEFAFRLLFSIAPSASSAYFRPNWPYSFKMIPNTSRQFDVPSYSHGIQKINPLIILGTHTIWLLKKYTITCSSLRLTSLIHYIFLFLAIQLGVFRKLLSYSKRFIPAVSVNEWRNQWIKNQRNMPWEFKVSHCKLKSVKWGDVHRLAFLSVYVTCSITVLEIFGSQKPELKVIRVIKVNYLWG